MAQLGRLARLVLPGLREVHGQGARYAAGWEEANQRARGETGPLWVVLGDSTAQGVGAPTREEGYVGQLLRILVDGTHRPWRVLNLSRSGARAVDVVDRQLPVLEELAEPPELVTCAIGANDIVRRTPPAVLEAQIRRIVARLPGQAVVATLPQGLSPARTEAANRVIREAAAAAGLPVAEVWAHTGPPWQGKFASDKFHPGARGYADWAAAFAAALPSGWLSEPRQPPHRLGSQEPHEVPPG